MRSDFGGQASFLQRENTAR